MSPAEHERAFDLFGSRVRLLIGANAPLSVGPEIQALRLEALLRRIHTELTRFDPLSRLSQLNRASGHSVPAGALVASLVEAGVEAASSTGGLVDFTVLGPLERAGYADSLVGSTSASLAEALSVAPDRRPASPDARRAWSSFSVEPRTGHIQRPPGSRIDGGGIAKGLAADLAAKHLSEFTSFAVDCGGDLRIGGTAGLARTVELSNPLVPGETMSIEMAEGGIATSGLGKRIWPHESGFAHHIIDPGTGQPAWTGIVQATALAATAREAEWRAKAALLSGAGSAREWLARDGGVLVFDSGEVEDVGGVIARSQALQTAL